MKRIAASLLAVGLLAAPVLAAETAPAPKAAEAAKTAPAQTESKTVAMAKKPATHCRHKRHAAVAKPKVALAPVTK